MTTKRVFGIAAILLALAAWAGATVVSFSAFQSTAQWSAPGSTTANLEPGTWRIVQKLAADSTAFLPSDVAAARTVNVEQVKVTDPSGADVALTCVYCSSQNASAWPIDLQMANGVADFRANVAGAYTITVVDAAGQMAVADPISKLEESAPVITGLGILGAVLMGVGVVLVVRGGSGSTPTASGTAQPVAAGPAPPGWYPNPYRPDSDSQMWWDGTQWTSNWR